MEWWTSRWRGRHSGGGVHIQVDGRRFRWRGGDPGGAVAILVGGGDSGGVVDIPGRGQKICPTSGVVGNLIQQMLIAQWAEEMIKAGAVPTFLRGIYQSGGREYNEAMAETYQRRRY